MILSEERRTEYERYLRSARWRNTRIDLMKMRGKRCEDCGRAALSLEVHHLNYDRFGCELPGDLEVLCHTCHRAADERRRIALQEDFERLCEERWWQNSFETWYEKVHGYSVTHATVYDKEEFNDWLEQKEHEY